MLGIDNKQLNEEKDLKKKFYFKSLIQWMQDKQNFKMPLY